MSNSHAIDLAPSTLSQPFRKFLGKEEASFTDLHNAVINHVRDFHLKMESGAVLYDETLRELLGETRAENSSMLLKHLMQAEERMFDLDADAYDESGSAQD